MIKTNPSSAKFKYCAAYVQTAEVPNKSAIGTLHEDYKRIAYIISPIYDEFPCNLASSPLGKNIAIATRATPHLLSSGFVFAVK